MTTKDKLKEVLKLYKTELDKVTILLNHYVEIEDEEEKKEVMKEINFKNELLDKFKISIEKYKAMLKK